MEAMHTCELGSEELQLCYCIIEVSRARQIIAVSTHQNCYKDSLRLPKPVRVLLISLSGDQVQKSIGSNIPPEQVVNYKKTLKKLYATYNSRRYDSRYTGN